VTRTTSSMILIISAMLVVFGSIAIAAQDKYTLKLGKLSFADFRGYENWKNVAVSQTEKQLKVILANDAMIDAYKRGLPTDGKFFPDGVKIVKIEWSFKKNPVSPYFVQVPDTLQAVDVIEKDTKKFPNTHGWAYANFVYDAASDTFTPEGTEPTCGFACHTTVASKDYIFTEYPKH
jgi:Cytochrome P460